MKRARSIGAAALFAAVVTPHAFAASISVVSLDQPGADSLTFVVDSIAAASITGPFSRYRVSNGAVSSMGTDVQPGTNLVGIGNFIWFTRRNAPYSLGRADVSLVSGGPDGFSVSGVTTPWNGMTLGPDNNLWATNAQSNAVVRMLQNGGAHTRTVFKGNGNIQPNGIAPGPDGNVWFADPGSRRVTRIDVNTTTFTDFPVPQLSANSIPERIAKAPDGKLWLANRDGFAQVDAATGAVHGVVTGAQAPVELAGAPDGTLWLTTGDQYVTQFTPPANVARLKVFPNANAYSSGLYIDADGVVYVSDRTESQLAKIGLAISTTTDTTVVEFHNSTLNHYFITANAEEATGIDQGTAGPGWSRTGQTWKAWIQGPISGAAEVCRFYGSIDINPATGSRRGPNSHFFTSEPAECASVKLDAGWTYEALAKFWVIKATTNTVAGCPGWTKPVYRAYNNRFMFNDSNHRYAVDVAIYNQMLALGWSGEGVVMCAPL